MSLKIQTTGIEQYAPGGEARLKMLLIGGPGAGKTRMSSYWPKPIYADCEKGLASVADRNVPYVNISTSQDMLEFLEFLKIESRKPTHLRNFETVVIDTLDAFQRKLKDEWLQKENKPTFTGWDAWGFLNSKMQALMTRLLNLDLNVIVNVHYKDKTIKDDETGRETRELMLQLSGEMADNAFNDFDFVGWIGTYWDKDGEGQRQQKRGLTFKASPDKPFLKDRLHVTPPWMEVQFAESDYTDLFSSLTEKFESLKPGEEIGEIPSLNDFASGPSAGVVGPETVGGGALPPMDPREVPYEQLDKPTLQKKARDLGVTFRGNTLKSELITAIRAKEAEQSATSAEAVTTPDATPETDATVASAPEPQATPEPEPVSVSTPAEAAPAATVETLEGVVDTATGELVAPPTEQTADDAAATVADLLGGTVISETVATETPQVPAPATPAAAPAAEPSADTCQECGTDLGTQNPDYVKLAFIKYRARLCDEHYLARRKS